MSVAAITPAPRMETVRWVVCFVIVVALHGAAAVALFGEFSEPADEASADTPVIMLDLPVAPAYSPPQDKPPGPMQEEDADPSPQPKEETKPPEPEAEIPLPKPEPPKPEPPQEEKHESAPAPAKPPPRSVVRWLGKLSAHIKHYIQYPDAALKHGVVTGTVTVRFTIDRKGHLLQSSIVESSGSAVLDKEALAVLARAQPMLPPPDEVTDLTFSTPVNFEPPK